MSDWLDRKIKPMLATTGQPFDSTEHIFEIKWDGIRTIAFVGHGSVRLQSRNLKDSTIRYPELVRALHTVAGEAILDGEIIVLEDGKPSFERVLEREQVRAPERITLRAHRHPAVYMVFDILYRNGRNLLHHPLMARREILSDLMRCQPADRVLETGYVLERGRAYFREAVDRGLEGVVAKSVDSPYVPGKRTRNWIKIKARRTLDCVVIGTIIEHGTHRVKSLVLGAYDRDDLVWLGNVGSGLDEKTLEELARSLEPLRGEPPGQTPVSAPGEVRWLIPALVARVNYMELTREGRLRAPVFVGFVDTHPRNCKAPPRKRR